MSKSKREERIEELEALGLDASRFKAMTDKEFEDDLDFQTEKLLRRKAEHRHKEKE